MVDDGTVGIGKQFELPSFVDDNMSFGLVPRGAARLEFAIQYNSKNELRGYFDALLRNWTVVHYTIDEYVAQGDAVVARGSTSWTKEKTGKTAETPKVDFWRFRNKRVAISLRPAHYIGRGEHDGGDC